MRDHEHLVAGGDQVAPRCRDPARQLGRAFAVGPVDVGLAVREPPGEVGLDARELIEREPLGDPEVGLAPAVVDRDVVDPGGVGDGGRRRLRSARRARDDARAGRQGRGEIAWPARAAAALPASSSGGSLRPQ